MATTQTEWRVLSQASLDQASVNTYHLAYNADDTVTAEPKAAQTFSNKPARPTAPDSNAYYKGAKRFGVNDDFIALRFAIANADNESGVCTIWTWDENGAAFNCLVLNLVVAGTSQVNTNPENLKALTDFRYADTITFTSNHCNAVKRGTDAANGIIEIRFDLRGAGWGFADFDMDLGAGTDGTDGICWYKTWGSS